MARLAPDVLQKAFAAFDAANAEDPNVEKVEGGEVPRELLYGQRMTERLDKAYPNAWDEVRLAARSQHLCRWERPRSEYPMNRGGYHAWRDALAVFHGERAAELLAPLGIESDRIERVKALLRKDNLKSDPNAQMLENVICLVFLEYYFDAFAEKHSEEKVVSILRKTWAKMSPDGQAAALQLPLSNPSRLLVSRALSP